jgi:hypothetical protein
MASRTLAGSLQLKGDWLLGEDAWKEENDANLLKLSVLVQGWAKDKVDTTPAAPAQGDVYLYGGGHAESGAVAVYDEGAWHLFQPQEGWLIYNKAAGYYEQFDGALWVEYQIGGGAAPIPEAPIDGQFYGRVSGTWVALLQDGLLDAPSDDILYARLNGEWVSFQLDSIPDAPDDGKYYVRRNNVWVESPGIAEAPMDGQHYVRSNGAWVLKLKNQLTTQVDYDALAVKDPNTLYYIPEAP